MKHRQWKILGGLFFSVFCLVLFVPGAFAGNATIEVSPATNTSPVGSSFQAALVVNGGGAQLNAAAATITLSSNIQVTDLKLGDCGFAFVKTPSTSDPSFAGAILGGSTPGCTVYTLTLQPTKSGSASLGLSKASVKEYKTAQELLSSTTDGQYTIEGTTSTSVAAPTTSLSPTQPPTEQSGLKYYTIIYSPAVSSQNTQVILDPNTPAEKAGVLGTTNNNPTVTFENVPAGVHTIETTTNGQKVAKEVVNISGPNRTISFGKSLKPPPPLAIWIVVFLIFVLLVGGISYRMYLYRKHQTHMQPKPEPEHKLELKQEEKEKTP